MMHDDEEKKYAADIQFSRMVAGWLAAILIVFIGFCATIAWLVD